MINETIKLAAKGCYYPINNDKQKQCMAWIIECLVLPPDNHGYTDEDMEVYISDAIKKISAHLPVPDYETVKKEETAFFKR